MTQQQSQAVTSANGSMFFQPGGPGSENPIYWLGHHDLGDVNDPSPRGELIQRYKADGSGREVIGQKSAPLTVITFNITEMQERARSYLHLFECPGTLYVMQGQCKRADALDGYERGYAVRHITKTDQVDSGEVMGGTAGDDDATTNYSLEGWPSRIYFDRAEVFSVNTGLGFDANSVSTTNLSICGGFCGPKETRGEYVYVSPDTAGAGTAASPQYSTNYGKADSWVTATNAPFGNGASIASTRIFRTGRSVTRWLVAKAADSGSQGQIAYTDDRGATAWNLVSVGASNASHFAKWHNALFATGKPWCWIATENGYIYKSSDGGVSWTAKESGSITTSDYYAISFDKTGEYGIAGAAGGVIALSSDRGETWSAGTSLTGAGEVQAVARMGPNRMLAATDDGELFYSLDGGVTWLENTNFDDTGTGGDNDGITDLKFVDGTDYHIAYMVHNSDIPVGTIYRTLNGGLTWQALTTPTNNGLREVAPYDTNKAYVVGPVITAASAAAFMRVTEYHSPASPIAE